MAMGGVMVVVALLMLGNFDTKFETAIANHLPSFLVDPSRGLESGTRARSEIAALNGRQQAHDRGVSEASRSSRLPVLGVAPDFVGNQHWFNTPGDRPLTLAGLRGRVVLVDFWTYSCINCLRTLPYLKAWDAAYRSRGLTIVGVHTPEFPFERSAANVRDAIAQNGLRYPVAQDNDYATWNAYSNQYWPAEYLIDAQGRLRLVHFGEGAYDAKERAIRGLLTEAGAAGLGRQTAPRAQQPSQADLTGESYLGAERATSFENGTIRPGVHDYGSPPKRAVALSRLRYAGRWSISRSAATAQPGARLDLRFRARRVFLVLGSPGRARGVRVLLDGRPLTASVAGADARGGRVRVGFERLYRLVDLPRVETHMLTLLPAAGVTGYAFTFG
jgi:thiol-disulfide isomerase/thioredoxin